MRTLKRICSSAIIIAVAGTAAVAQNTNYTQVEASSGRPTRIAYHASAKKDCTPAPLPTLRMIEPPKSGTLITRRAIMTTNKIAGCPGLKTPAQVMFYQSRPGYLGRDRIVYEVTSAEGKVVVYDITITVKTATKPSPKPSNKSDTPI